MRIVGEIPARAGSKRVPKKNLRLLEGKPLISYAIEAGKQAKRLTEVYVNSDSDEIGKLALERGVKFYKRPADLGSDKTSQDEFNYDFMKAVQPDILVMINPVSPLIEGKDIDAMTDHFLREGLDTLIAVQEVFFHALCKERPVNFEPNRRLERTQDLPPLQICAWSVAIWRAKSFIEQYQEKGHAAFSGKVGLFPLNRFKAVKISTEEDFILAEILVRNQHRWRSRVSLRRP